MTDRVIVEGIEFHGFHGVGDAERIVGHRFRVDLELELDLRSAGESDDVMQTVDYSAAAATVVRIGVGDSVRLVETLAERIAAALLGEFPQLQAVTIRATKIMPPAVPMFAASTIAIRRIRQ